MCATPYTWGDQPLPQPLPFAGRHQLNWQKYPVLIADPSVKPNDCPYNWDRYSFPDSANGIKFIRENRQALFGNFPTINLNASDPQQALQVEHIRRWVQEHTTGSFDPETILEPHTEISIPIFDTQTEAVYVNINTTDQATRMDDREQTIPRVVGNLGISILFREFLINVLPENSNGIIVVVEQTMQCGGTPFTYRIDGDT